MHMWFGSSSEVHPLKADQTNADAFFVGSRFRGVFDGVGGVANEGLHPNAMSVDLANRVSAEMEVRLGDNVEEWLAEVSSTEESGMEDSEDDDMEVPDDSQALKHSLGLS